MNCNLKMGDLLYRQKNFVQHAAVYVGNNMVFHISPSNGAETISFNEYSADSTVKVIHTNFENKYLLEERLKEILISNGNYHVALNNCEHIATYLIYGRKISTQLQATFCGIIVGVLLGRKLTTSNKISLIIICGVAGCLLDNSFRQYDAEIPPTGYLDTINI